MQTVKPLHDGAYIEPELFVLPYSSTSYDFFKLDDSWLAFAQIQILDGE
ncbi:hypothetical protein SDC9_158022 [bioreactor metagenome]|uniref:Uncharacterized protein n=1 Tax=bioreactor metagenome TaxID=1076179 RepID=A0A645F8M1_9ZZZZ